jgi:transcriptional regulator with XRE-family HTH domain
MPTTTRHLGFTAAVYAERIARNIRMIRRDKDIPARTIIAALQINGAVANKNTLSELERGKTTPTLVEALIIAHILGVDVADLSR